MTITDSVRSVFRNYATFSGRASRSEFWWWTLVSTLVSVALIFTLPLLVIVWALAVMVPSLAVGWRRLHDTNLAGAFYLLTYVGSGVVYVKPVLGLVEIVGLILCIRPGTPGPNRFGPSPRGAAHVDDPGLSRPTCPTCGSMILPGRSQCPSCGTDIP